MPKAITYYSDIEPYNGELFETKMQEEKYWCHLTTKTTEGWKKDIIYATVKHADKILDIFKDISV